MKNTILIITAAALLCGCAGLNSGITSGQDRFTNKTINQTQNNNLSMGLGENIALLLDARQEIDASGAAQYFLILSSYSLEHAALIPTPTTDSLFIIADDKRFSLKTSTHMGFAYFYPATKDQISSMGNATNVEVRVIQFTGNPVEKRFNANNRATFKKFADKFLK
jgi:hypothetical protein